MVHRAERRVGKVAVKTGAGDGEGRAARARPLRHLRDAGGRRVVVLAGGLVHRAHRPAARGDSIVVEPPTKDQGARRVWSDSRGRIWVSEWNSGNVSMHDPAARRSLATWKLPGDEPARYAVYVDERDMVWLSDFGGNAVFRFDPAQREVRALRLAARRRQRAPDPRPAGRGVAAGERHGAHLGDSHRVRARLVAAATSALAGCASLPAPYTAQAVTAQDAACMHAFATLDAAVDRSGVRDAESDRIAGFPTLRIDRLGAALLQQATSNELTFDAWLQRARGLDLAGRRVERSNLPAGDAAMPSEDRIAACSRQLTDSLRRDIASRSELLARARVPDRYSAFARAAGLYALTRVPFFAGIERWQAAHEAAMRDAAARPQPATRLVPSIPAADAPRPDSLARDALGLLRLDDVTAERLLAAHAPVFDIEARGAFDAIGTPAWRADGSLSVDTARPVVYQRIGYTLVQGRPLVQLVFTLWFPQRPRRGPVDLLGGNLDGVIVRLTLGPDGHVLVLDTIHACGCYHLFFPAPGLKPRPGAPTDEEWAFAPAPLPALAAGQRVVVRIESATHYVLGVSATDSPTPKARLPAPPESDLQRLPQPAGGTRSLYRADGLVAGSERSERFFYWPMGIASAGAMRQWGHHATAFVGRRHFDDADLLDRRFDWPPLD